MSEITLQELALLVGGELRGDPNLRISGADIIRDVAEGQITFASAEKHVANLKNSQAAAAIVPLELEVDSLSTIAVSDVVAAFTTVVKKFRPHHAVAPALISAQANVDSSAKIDSTATICAGATIGAQCVVGANTVIHAGVTLMDGVSVGSQTTVFPGAVIYENCVIGSRNLIHANAVIGAYGFGYDSSSGKHLLSAQLGNVVLGDDVEIGAGTTIDRGTYGSTKIGDGTKVDNQVMIGHNCRIGKHNLLCSQVGIAGSSSTGDYVVMAGQVGIGDHLEVESGVTLGAKAGVMTRVPAGETWVGIPATPMRDQVQRIAAVAKLPELRKQFRKLQKQVAALEDSAKSSQVADCKADMAVIPKKTDAA